MGTRYSGLIRWDISTNEFQQYTTKEGLSNDNIYAIYEDDFDRLWLPSDYGLMSFDKKSHITKVYLPQNGIAHEEFNSYSHFKDEDGRFYFGGIDGITSFHPKDFQNKK